MAKKPALPPLDPMLKDFVALSRVLTGVEKIDENLARQYLDRLRSTPFEPFLRQVLDRFRRLKGGATLVSQVKQQIVEDDTLRPTICQIILLWYTSGMQDQNPTNPGALRYGTQEEYFSGLAWSIVGAHVPGLSGGYFGHWRYRPDNEPGESI
jgi:hypothetical protein